MSDYELIPVGRNPQFADENPYELLPVDRIPQFQAGGEVDEPEPPTGTPNPVSAAISRMPVLQMGVGPGFPGAHAPGAAPIPKPVEEAPPAPQEPAPQFYSAVGKAVDSAKINSAPANQWLGTIKNTPGVKPEEMDWMGVEDWLKGQQGNVSKQAVQDYLRGNQVGVQEVLKGEPKYYVSDHNGIIRSQELSHDEARTFADEIGGNMHGSSDSPARYSEHQLPGGENYREMLLTLPPTQTQSSYQVIPKEKPHPYVPGSTYRSLDVTRNDGHVQASWSDTPEGRQQAQAFADKLSKDDAWVTPRFTTSHWDEPNVLAHVRFNDRTIDGKPTLFMEEVQSDWHQKGRAEGYASAELPELPSGTRENIRSATQGTLLVPSSQGDYDLHFAIPWSPQTGLDVNAARMQARQALQKEQGTVPDAPFKTTWPELVLKRMIRYAAENGYDKIAWTPGSVQADRYDLSKHVSQVYLRPNLPPYGGAKYQLVAKGLNGEAVLTKPVSTQEEVANYIGKEPADKLFSEENTKRLNAGLHTKLEGQDLKIGGEGMKGFYDKMLPAAANKLGKKYGTKVQLRALHVPNDFENMTDEEREGYAQDEVDGRMHLDTKEESVHTMEITPELKKAALYQGFPLFTRGGAVHRADGGGLPTKDPPPQWNQPVIPDQWAKSLPLETQRQIGLNALRQKTMQNIVDPVYSFEKFDDSPTADELHRENQFGGKATVDTLKELQNKMEQNLANPPPQQNPKEYYFARGGRVVAAKSSMITREAFQYHENAYKDRCGICRYFSGSQGCGLFRMINQRMPEDFALNPKVPPTGWCSAFTNKNAKD